jgi:hypothetical protein
MWHCVFWYIITNILEEQAASIFKVGDTRFLYSTANELPTTQCHIPEESNFTGHHISTRMEYKRNQLRASTTSSSQTFHQNQIQHQRQQTDALANS